MLLLLLLNTLLRRSADFMDDVAAMTSTIGWLSELKERWIRESVVSS